MQYILLMTSGAGILRSSPTSRYIMRRYNVVTELIKTDSLRGIQSHLYHALQPIRNYESRNNHVTPITHRDSRSN
jgi:hypothetical protein